MDMQQRIVITGIGAVTSIGTGGQQFWDNVLAGRCGISPVESFDTKDFSVHRGGEVKGFCPGDHVLSLDPDHLGRSSQFAIAAARMALADADEDLGAMNPERVGVSLGTTLGESFEMQQALPHFIYGELEKIRPDFMSTYPCHVLTAHVGCELQVSGINMVIPAACAAGNYAIAYAFDALRSGRADLMLAGGVDAFSRLAFTGFARLGALAPDVCQPFDRNRKGMIPGEGAAMMVLEPLDRAVKRNARIYAEVLGYGQSCDAYHITSSHPQGNGPARAMEKALNDSGLNPQDVSYISAHGTGTRTNDRIETAAIKRVFKEEAYRIPISSIKSMLGHTLGAASAIEAVACALAVFHDTIPPTINFQEPDPECDLDYVPNEARTHSTRVAMNNAYGFGGYNSSLILSKCRI